MDISVNIHYFKLKCSVYNHNIILEGSVSQHFDSLHLNPKNACFKFERCM